MKSLKNRESKRDGLLFLPSTDLCGSPTPTCRTYGRVSKVVADQDDLTQSRYMSGSSHVNNQLYESQIFVYLLFEYLLTYPLHCRNTKKLKNQ